MKPRKISQSGGRTRPRAACLTQHNLRGYRGIRRPPQQSANDLLAEAPTTAIFKPEGPLFRATEQAGGPWSPDMLQGSATTALMTREAERLTKASGFAVRRLTFDLRRPAGLRALGLASELLRDGRKAKTLQVRLMDGETEIGRCTALLTVQGAESPVDPFAKAAGADAPPESGTPPPGVAQIVDMREWTFINPEISLYFFRQPVGDWILIRSRTRVGAGGAGLTMATLSDRQGPFAEVMQAMSFERREAQAQAQAS
jgi:Thioesterase-like superfamily